MTPFLAGAIAEMIPNAGDAERCAECGFAWASAAAACRARVDGAAEVFERLLATTGADLGAAARRSDPDADGWTAAAYVWHLGDVLRAWSERLHTLSVDSSIPWAGFDPDELAAARRYDVLPMVTAPWALARAIDALAVALAPLTAEDEFVHPEWGEGTVADALRWLAHEVVHHELDVRRALRLRG
jgi:hypothetical protein